MTDKPDQIPAFDAHGNLPDDDYWPAEADFEARFVKTPGSTRRAAIYQGFKKHRAALQREGVRLDRPCMLDGSYTTSKAEPGDIDLVVEVDPDLFDHSQPVQELLAGPAVKGTYSCDAYPLPVYPQGHPHYRPVTEHFRNYWRKWFGRDRAGNPKGRIWATVQGFR